jgi:hypothetical protein
VIRIGKTSYEERDLLQAALSNALPLAPDTLYPYEIVMTLCNLNEQEAKDLCEELDLI